MKIIKYTLNTLAAIFTIGAIFTACSEKELANENEQSLDKKGYTLTIEATKAAPTKALAEAGGNIVASWAEGEKVSVFNSSQVKIGELTAQYSGVSTVLSGELTTAPAVADVLKLEFCSASYTAQDGTLAYIAANCDYATADVTVKTVANNTITTEAHANFVNQQAIVKFTLKNDAVQPAAINLSQLTIKVSGSASDVTVTPASAASELYVALPAVADGSIELIGTAEPKTYTYARNGVTFEKGKFYPITVNMTSAVAKIGDVKYDTLAEAIAAVPTDGTKTTITMIANETMATGASITIAATQNVVLDLNGKTVTGNGGLNGANFFLLTNKGTLEITDLSSGKTGKLTGYWTSPNTGYSNQYVTIYNAGGTLTLTAGTVETTSGYLSYAINNTSNAWGVGDDKESVFNMTGGTLTASNGGDAALRVYQNCADTANPFSHNYVTISGGTIASGGIFLDNYIYHPHENTTGEGIITNVTITGGEIHGLIDMKLRHAFHTSINISGGTFLESKLRVRKVNNSDTDRWDPSIENPSSPVFNISGGNFTFVNGYAFGLNSGYNGTDWSTYIPYSVTGGTFSVDPSTYVAVGYAATGTGPYTVSQIQGVAAIGSTGYPSLAEAVDAAKDGDTITLLADDDISLTNGQELEINKPLTITGAVDAMGEPKYTVYGTPNFTGSYNDLYLTSTSGTITISNIRFSNFGDETPSSKNGRAPLFIGSNNHDAIIENVYISDINTEAVHINGGSFLIQDCAFDCANLNGESIFTRGIQVTNHAHGSIINTDISNTVAIDAASTAPIELLGDGTILIENCQLSAADEDNENSIGIAVGPCADQPGGSQVTVRNCNVTAYKALYGDGDTNAQLTVESGVYVGSLLQGDNGTGITITGGSFSSDPTLYVADGYGAIYTSGTCPYQVTNLNWANYAASDADFTAATNGTTISINSAALLAKFAKNVNSGVTYNGYTIELTADIDLAGKIWTPIGINEDNQYKTFEGIFNGNNHTIANLNCSSNEDKPIGLFGVSYAPATVKNLNLSNVFVSGVHQTGAIFGNGKEVTIQDCVVDGGRVVAVPHWTASGYDDGNQVGGIAGYLFAEGFHVPVNVTRCTVRNLIIKAYRDVGGIAGATNNSTDNLDVIVQYNTVENCTIIADQTCPYKEVRDFNAGEIVGRKLAGTVEDNTATSVTVVTRP